MKYLLYTALAFVLCCHIAQAQVGRSAQNKGLILGKIIDSASRSGLGGAGIQVLLHSLDSGSQQPRATLIRSTAAQGNGDFELDDMPVNQPLKLIIALVGYNNREINITLHQDTTTSHRENQDNENNPAESIISTDLGKIALQINPQELGAVVVQSKGKQMFEMGIDRKIFNVDQNISSSGQSAQEVMRNIPSVNVDIDGNLTLRNATPQIFIDGRPTTLTLDQIPSDLIDRVELITNPSAKYDASGGGGGIVNIVMKKNRKVGYNGGLRSGVDTRGAYNIGGDISVKQGKFNVFADGMYRQRRSNTTNYYDRHNINDTSTLQNGKLRNRGYFAMFNLGTDYFLDNHNTFTVSGSLGKGSFNNTQAFSLDSIDGQVSTGLPYSYSNINSTGKNSMTNIGGQFSYKHNFEKSGHNLGLDVNYRSTNTDNQTETGTSIYNEANTTSMRYPNILQRSIGDGYNRFWTIQSDYENPISDKVKLEAGVRAAIRNFASNSFQYTDSSGIGAAALLFRPTISSKYRFNDQVYAAYATLSSKWGDNLSYQVGLRMESSNYTGNNTWLQQSGADSTTAHFKVKYPANLFPSLFVTYALGDHQNVQFNYSRKVNRPTFFQLLPTPDVSDPQNIRVGNPDLRPEFTNNFELSYDNRYGASNTFMATAYLRHTTDLITGFQYIDSSYTNAPSALVNTYVNANKSYTYGLELTNKWSVISIWDMIANVNIFNSKINGGSAVGNVANQRVSWFAKLNNNFKLPQSISVQLSGIYQAKSILPNNQDDNQGRGNRFGPSVVGSSQGYIKPTYSIDLAIKKDWKLKGSNSISLTLAMNDIFRTNYVKNYIETPYLTQNSSRLRDAQVGRLMLSWRFGKMDASLFKKKNTKANSSEDGGEIMN